jgi:U3 small nucleolar ribonucleoprotein component
VLSTFEKEQEKLRKQIEELEAENVKEKSWALKGEVRSFAH